MTKKKQTEAISWHQDAKARTMQLELQTWMETHELTHDTKWWTADEFYHGKHLEFDEPPQLVLTFDGDLYNVFSCPPDMPGIEWFKERREEFDAIIEQHNYWYEFEDGVTMSFMSDKD
jgi:hypothetical protein